MFPLFKFWATAKNISTINYQLNSNVADVPNDWTKHCQTDALFQD